MTGQAARQLVASAPTTCAYLSGSRGIGKGGRERSRWALGLYMPQPPMAAPGL